MSSITTWDQQCSMIVRNDLRALRNSLESGGVTAYTPSPTSQFSLLHVAARYGRTIIVEELMASGIPVDVLDMWGHTPLHYASVCGHKNVVVSLIQNGAAVSRCNDMGHTPLDYASSEEVAMIMRRFYSRTAARDNPDQFPDHAKQIHKWLAHNRCEHYLDMFLVSGFDDLSFIRTAGLSEKDLDDIGVNKPGHRKKLAALHGIDLFLQDTGSTPGSGAESGSDTGSSEDSDSSGDSDSDSDSASGSESGSSGSYSESSGDDSSDDSDES